MKGRTVSEQPKRDEHTYEFYKAYYDNAQAKIKAWKLANPKKVEAYRKKWANANPKTVQESLEANLKRRQDWCRANPEEAQKLHIKRLEEQTKNLT
jgi:hypothetical protein